VATDETALLASLFSGVSTEERRHLVDLLTVHREDSGARLAPRRPAGRGEPGGRAEGFRPDGDCRRAGTDG